MKIAVCIYSNRLLISKSKCYYWSFANLKAFTLTALIGLKIYPKNAMLCYHRMLYRANGYGYGVAANRYHGNMLFAACINSARDQLRHLLTTAHHRNPCVMYHTDKIAAMLTDVKLIVVTHGKILRFLII
jgi:hypothetical protein